jgi:replicative DNA helicase
MDAHVVPDVLRVIPLDRADAFYDPSHRAIYKVIVEMADSQQPLDLVTFQAELNRREMLEIVGGIDYAVLLVESVPSAANATYYAEIVRDRGLQRDLIAVCGEMSDKAYGFKGQPKELLDEAERAMYGLTDRRVLKAETHILAGLEEAYANMHRGGEGVIAAGAIPTGFTELDDLLSGMHPEMIVVAGRPSMGKTAFGLDIARNVAVRQEKAVIFYTMEMSAQALIYRLMCAEAHVDSQRIRRGQPWKSEEDSLESVKDQLKNCPLYVDDSSNMSLFDLRAKARQAVRRHNAELVIIDYLQLMSAARRRNESRQQEVSEISRGIKELVKELAIPFVVMAQLNRNPEAHMRRPKMSELRESGAIEQDADVVLLLHRPEYYMKDQCDPDMKGKAELILDKQRNGPTGVIKLAFDGPSMSFNNLAGERAEPYVEYEESVRDPSEPEKEPDLLDQAPF